MLFAIEDLFAAGIGFDIAGGYLVARGIISSPEVIARRDASVYGRPAVIASTEIVDDVSGRFGLVALIVGFSLQAVAYAWITGGAPTSDRGLEQALVAVATTVAAACVALSAWRSLRGRFDRRTIVRMAQWDLIAGVFHHSPLGDG